MTDKPQRKRIAMYEASYTYKGRELVFSTYVFAKDTIEAQRVEYVEKYNLANEGIEQIFGQIYYLDHPDAAFVGSDAEKKIVLISTLN